MIAPYRTIRGGSRLADPWTRRSAYRNYDVPSFRVDRIGFRVICPERTFLRKPVRGGSIYGPATALRARACGFAPVAQDTCIMGFRVVCLPTEVTP